MGWPQPALPQMQAIKQVKSTASYPCRQPLISAGEPICEKPMTMPTPSSKCANMPRTHPGPTWQSASVARITSPCASAIPKLSAAFLEPGPSVRSNRTDAVSPLNSRTMWPVPSVEPSSTTMIS